MKSISLPRHPEASQIPVNGHSFINRRIIWSALGQGLSTGGCGGKGFLHSCWLKETWEFPAGNPGILQLRSRDRSREQHLCPRHWALQRDRVRRKPPVPRPTPPGFGEGQEFRIQPLGFQCSRDVKEKESLGMDQRKAAGQEDTCELFLSPPWGSSDKAVAE